MPEGWPQPPVRRLRANRGDHLLLPLGAAEIGTAVSRAREDQRLLSVHGLHTDWHAHTTEIAGSCRIGLVDDGVFRDDADTSECVHDLLETAEVDHDRVVDLDSVEFTEQSAQCSCWTIWEHIGVALAEL